MSWLTEQQIKALGFKHVGIGVKISPHAHIIGHENISIHDNVRIDIGARLFAAKGWLSILDHVHIATGALLLAAGGIHIGKGCAVGFDSKLISASDDFSGDVLIGPVFPSVLTNVKARAVRMNRLSVLGTGCTVMPGVNLAEGSAAGANTLLLADTKPWSIYIGQPARLVRTRSSDCLKKFEAWDKEWKDRVSRMGEFACKS